MKIFNETKTQKLNESELDLDNGYLKPDKLLIAHHDAIPFKPGKTAREIADELILHGVVVEESPIGLFRVVEEAEGGGRITEEIKAESAIPAQDAWDEYKDIQVYVPYTAQELEERRLTALRARREPLLNAFDKWEKAVLRGREDDSNAIMDWYYDILDLKEYAFENVPERIKYYL